MDSIADIAEEYAFDEMRVSHEQNLILPHVALADLESVYRGLVAIGLAEANAGLITDIIACPAWTTARSPMRARSLWRRRFPVVSPMRIASARSAN
jgi:sulfite reductase (NADPH) hemoprotein beta-component